MKVEGDPLNKREEEEADEAVFQGGRSGRRRRSRRRSCRCKKWCCRVPRNTHVRRRPLERMDLEPTRRLYHPLGTFQGDEVKIGSKEHKNLIGVAPAVNNTRT